MNRRQDESRVEQGSSSAEARRRKSTQGGLKETVIIAGFGGQGVLSMGKILAYAGVVQGYEVSWMPAYGPEMRGGTANVTVILSDKPISSPIAHRFDSAIILNQQSMDKFEELVRPGGVLVYDTTGITRHPSRTDIDIYAIDATGEAARRGMVRMFNTMVLGGFLAVHPIVKPANVVEGLRSSLPERVHGLIPANQQALEAGASLMASAGYRASVTE